MKSYTWNNLDLERTLCLCEIYQKYEHPKILHICGIIEKNSNRWAMKDPFILRKSKENNLVFKTAYSKMYKFSYVVRNRGQLAFVQLNISTNMYKSNKDLLTNSLSVSI